MKITIEGWHINNFAAKCDDCGMPALVVAQPNGMPGVDYYFNLCNMCLGCYEIVADHIADVFRKEGL